MKKLAVTLVILFSLSITSYANLLDLKTHNPNSSIISKPINDKLKRFLAIADSLQRQAEVPGVGLAIVYNNKVIYTGGLGFSDLKKRQPVTENTLFMIGSTTKAFTGVIAAKRVEQGQLEWKKPIINYLPDFKLSEPYIAKTMNIEDALIHMTGLERKDELWHQQPLSRKEVFKQVETLEFPHGFRGEWAYNNHMYVVVGEVLEKVSNKSWEELIRQEIFKPLSMSNSYVSHENFVANLNKSESYQTDGLTPRSYISTDNIAPAGAVSSTPKDISKWLSMFVNEGKYEDKTLIQPEEYEYLTSPKGMSLVDPCKVRYYTVGWGANMTNGKKYLSHNGGIGGFNSKILVMPQDGFGIFIMTNQRSDYKDILVDYAENIFVKNHYERDSEREDLLRSNTFYIRFQNTVLEQDIEQAKAFYKTIPYKNFEAQMNNLGYYLMQEGEMEKALLVFKLNVQDHPKSSNAYDSYGEVLFQVGSKDKSIEMYEKSIELDPNNENGIEMLKRIRDN